MPDGGNHRGSIFRRHIGAAMLNAPDPRCEPCATWGVGSSAPRSTREAEYEVERAVSQYVGAMKFLWVGVDDERAPTSDRKVIERNAIALLSNRHKGAIDPPSSTWLGRKSETRGVPRSRIGIADSHRGLTSRRRDATVCSA
jgi:hypothetical protein